MIFTTIMHYTTLCCIAILMLYRSSNSIVGYAVVYILRLIGHTHDRESPIQNFSTAPKKLGAHISSPVWSPKPTEFVSYLGNLRCDAFTELKSIQSFEKWELFGWKR